MTTSLALRGWATLLCDAAFDFERATFVPARTQTPIAPPTQCTNAVHRPLPASLPTVTPGL